ncbi:phosphatase PAP2-related protein [Aquirufa sp. ROCK2-A2]
MKSFINSLRTHWSIAWKDSFFRWNFIGALAYFAIFPWKADDYFQWIQKREGIQLYDWLLQILPAVNVSYPIFGIIYLSVIYLLCQLLQDPKKFLWFAWAFNLETSLRFITIYCIPLNPPSDLIVLNDPLAEIFIYGENFAITKDLFFSGHTATMVFVWVFLRNRIEKQIAFVLGISLIGFLLLQHIHYSIDIIGAVGFTLFSIWATGKYMRRFDVNN